MQSKAVPVRVSVANGFSGYSPDTLLLLLLYMQLTLLYFRQHGGLSTLRPLSGLGGWTLRPLSQARL